MRRHRGHIFHDVTEWALVETDHAYSVLLVETRDFQVPYLVGHN